MDQISGLDAMLSLIDSWGREKIGGVDVMYDPTRYLTDGILSRDPGVMAALSERAAVLTDEEKSHPLLKEGMFAEYPLDQAAALIALSSEMTRERNENQLYRAIERYNPYFDRLLVDYPELNDAVDKKREMISIKDLRQIGRSSAFQFFPSKETGIGNPTFKLTKFIDPEVVNFIQRHAGDRTRTMVRLDPDYPNQMSEPPFATYTPELPPQILECMQGVRFEQMLEPRQEHVVSPGAQALEGLHRARALMDYYVTGLRGLASWGYRTKDGAEGYFEELIELGSSATDATTGEWFFKSKGTAIGRMIHFDTSMALDTPWEKVELNHLDLAINVYERDQASQRLNKPLYSSVVIDTRGHILKSAPIELKLLPGIAWLFFPNSRLQLMQLFLRILG